MAIAKVADINYVFVDASITKGGEATLSYPALNAGDLIVIYGFGYAANGDNPGIYGAGSTTGITWINSPDPNAPSGGIGYYEGFYFFDISSPVTGTANDNISCSLYLGKVNSPKAAGSMNFGIYSVASVFGVYIDGFLGGTFGGIVLSGTSSSPLGNYNAYGNSATTNNLTTSPITTTANNSWLLTAGYTPATSNSTSSDLTVPTRNLAYGQLLGYKTVATSGTSVTSNLDAPGTANATWVYETAEIKAATTPSLTAYGPSIRR